MGKTENHSALHARPVDEEMKISLVTIPFADIVFTLLIFSEWVSRTSGAFLSNSLG